MGQVRGMIQAIKDKYPMKKNLIGVEIGVLAGVNAEVIMRTLDIKKLYLVDSYIPYYCLSKKRISFGKNNDDPEIYYREAKKRMEKYGDRIEFIKKKSVDAVDDIPDNLDFVYIDAEHTYEAVKQDIKAYYPKIKHHGIIGGHDFNIKEPLCKGLINAVYEFHLSHDVPILSAYNDWWMTVYKHDEIFNERYIYKPSITSKRKVYIIPPRWKEYMKDNV